MLHAPFYRFRCVCFASGVYRKCVLEEVLTPDQDVHVSFRRIGLAVFLATNGFQSPVWRSRFCACSCVACLLSMSHDFLLLYRMLPQTILVIPTEIVECHYPIVYDTNSYLVVRSLHRYSHKAHTKAHDRSFVNFRHFATLLTKIRLVM